jgi:hypothetical protein
MQKAEVTSARPRTAGAPEGFDVSILKLTTTSLLMAVALLISGGIGPSGASSPSVLQETAEATDETTATDPAAVPVTPLAGSATVSPSQPWITELRIPVILENTSPTAAPADLSALGGLTFSVRDTAGNIHGLDTARPHRGAQPNHSLRSLEPGTAARWTLGFQVPSTMASGLTLELHFGPEIVASWSIDDLPSSITAVTTAADGGTTVTLAREFDWAPEVAVTALEVGSLVCGDPAIETVTQIVAVAFEVTNSGAGEVRWPGYVHRDGASMAQWADGTAADMSMETFVGNSETLPRVSTSAVRIPATVTSTRAMVFAAPRDGRFTDTATLPIGVSLRTDNGPAWLDLTGAEATLPMSPAFCDLGFFGAPVPYSYSPNGKYQVGGEAPAADPAVLDKAAQSLITQALSGAALYYDSHNQSFANLSGEELFARAPSLSFVGHDVGEDLAGDTGTVYFASRPDDNQFLYVVTRSGSGRWFCAGITPHRSVLAGDGMDLSKVSDLCYPEVEEDES